MMRMMTDVRLKTCRALMNAAASNTYRTKQPTNYQHVQNPTLDKLANKRIFPLLSEYQRRSLLFFFNFVSFIYIKTHERMKLSRRNFNFLKYIFRDTIRPPPWRVPTELVQRLCLCLTVISLSLCGQSSPPLSESTFCTTCGTWTH